MRKVSLVNNRDSKYKFNKKDINEKSFNPNQK